MEKEIARRLWDIIHNFDYNNNQHQMREDVATLANSMLDKTG